MNEMINGLILSLCCADAKHPGQIGPFFPYSIHTWAMISVYNFQKITEQKLQAFAIGTMGQRPLSRREQEEKRKKEEEEAAAHVMKSFIIPFAFRFRSIHDGNSHFQVFKEFVETFQDTPSSVSKVWVKAGTYDAGSRSTCTHPIKLCDECDWIGLNKLILIFAEEDHRDKGKLYKPQTKLEERSSNSEKSSSSSSKKESNSSSSSSSRKNPKAQEKKKSNLELFKEELRQ